MGNWRRALPFRRPGLPPEARLKPHKKHNEKEKEAKEMGRSFLLWSFLCSETTAEWVVPPCRVPTTPLEKTSPTHRASRHHPRRPPGRA
jgi:hypothetical protein